MLSSIILTHNEAHNIRKAITSVLFSDEIIVIDDYSTDDTVTLAAKLGAQIYKRRLNNDFSAQRNFGLSKAKGDWILFIDADEFVTGKLKTEILTVITTPSPTTGYYLKRQDKFMNKVLNHGETSRVRLLRLAKKGVGEWHRSVHELWQITGPTKTLNNPLLHSSHSSLAQFLTSINHYTSIEAKLRASRGRQFSLGQLLVFPPAKFILNYIFRLGFLDGVPGFIMAFFMSLHSLILRVKLYEAKSPSQI